MQTDEEDVLVGESEDESEAAAAAAAGSPAAAAAAASPTVFLPDVQTDGEPKIILKDNRLFYRENKGKRLDDYRALCELDTQLLVAAPKKDFNCLAPTPDILKARNQHRWRR
eukprot:COSAG02_NODE_3572_length_6543_cov_3.650217_6_plen_112_part_00